MIKKKIRKIISLTIISVMILITFCGCTTPRQAERVSYNLSQEADNFNITRRLAVINARTDKPVFELIGNFSIETDSVDKQLEITVEVSQGNYKKHFVNLNEWTIYVVEDVSGAYVDKYHYQVNFLPQMIVPVTFVSND